MSGVVRILGGLRVASAMTLPALLKVLGHRQGSSSNYRRYSQVTACGSGLEEGLTRISCPLSDISCAIRFIPMVWDCVCSSECQLTHSSTAMQGESEPLAPLGSTMVLQ